MPTFILIITLLGPNGVTSEHWSIERTSRAECVAEMVRTYATPMGRYRLVSATCVRGAK